MEQLVVPDEDVLVGQAAAHAARHGAALPVLAEDLDPGVVVPHLRQRHARQVAAQRGAAPTQTLVTTILGQAMPMSCNSSYSPLEIFLAPASQLKVRPDLTGICKADPQILAQVNALSKQPGLVEVLLQPVVEDAVEVVQAAAVKCPKCLLILHSLAPPPRAVGTHLENVMRSRVFVEVSQIANGFLLFI